MSGRNSRAEKREASARLRVQPAVQQIAGFGASAFSALIIIFGYAKIKSNGGVVALFIAIFSFGCVFGLVYALINLQFAVITEKGVIIKSPFRKIADVKWQSIRGLEIRKLPLRGRGAANYEWIVIKTSKSERVDCAAKNKKRSPWYVIATPHNIETIKKLFEIYALTGLTRDIR